MNKELFTVTGNGLIIFVLTAAAVLLVTYLIILLRNINKTVKKVNSMLDANRENIDNTLNSLPQICKNVDSVTAAVKDKAGLLDDLISGSEESAASFDLKSIIGSVAAIIELFSGIASLLKGKKDFFKKS